MTLASIDDGVQVSTRVDLTLSVGTLPDGTALHVPVTVLRGAAPGPRVVITAGVHGDEFVGPLALGRLIAELDPAALRGTLLLLPIVNRLAFRAVTRNTPADGLNLNREFPGRPDGSITQRLAHIVMERVVRGADALVDLHGGGLGQRFMPIVGCRPEFDRLGPETCRLAAAFGWDFLWGMPPVPGVLSFEACRLGVPAVGVEVGGQGSAQAAEIALEVSALKRLLTTTGTLPGEAPLARGRDAMQAPPLLVGERTYAPASGLFAPVVEVGQRVSTDEVLGVIWSAGGVASGEVVAPRSGILVAFGTVAPVHEGDFVALVLGRPPET